MLTGVLREHVRENKTGILKQHSAGLNLRYSQISELNGKKAKQEIFIGGRNLKPFIGRQTEIVSNPTVIYLLLSRKHICLKWRNSS